MPMIKKCLSRYLADRIADGRSEDKWLHISNPERAIAEGAAKYAYMLANDIAKDDGILLSVEEKSSHSYGTTIQNRSTGEKFIRNLILSTDPMIVDSKPFEFGVMKVGQGCVDVDLYENNSTEERIPYKADLRQIYNKKYIFDSKVPVTTETKIYFTVGRNKDGLISIHVESPGHQPDDFENISTAFPPVSKETRESIIRSIELMDRVPDECK